jgi:hypothetical protein
MPLAVQLQRGLNERGILRHLTEKQPNRRLGLM